MTNNVVENYGWTSNQGPHSCAYIVPEIQLIIKNLKVNRIMDLGSGNGRLCSDLAKNNYDVVGVEYDKEGVEISKKLYPKINFYNYGVQDNPEDLLKLEKPFDAVISTEVIEHLFSPHFLPEYAHTVLKENGYLIITTPYHGYFKNLCLSIFNKWDHHHTALWHGGHIKFWSEKTLSELLTKNGFRIVKFGGVGRIKYLWKSMIMVAQKVSS